MKKQILWLLLIIASVNVENPVNAMSTKESAVEWLKAIPLALSVFELNSAYSGYISRATLIHNGSWYANSINKSILQHSMINSITNATMVATFMDIGAKTGKWIENKINPKGTGELGAIVGAGIVGGMAAGGLFIDAFALSSSIKLSAIVGYSMLKTITDRPSWGSSSWGLPKFWNTPSENSGSTLQNKRDDTQSEGDSNKSSRKIKISTVLTENQA